MSFTTAEAALWRGARGEKPLLVGGFVHGDKPNGLLGQGAIQLVQVQNQFVFRFLDLRIPNVLGHDLALYTSSLPLKADGRIPKRAVLRRVHLDVTPLGLYSGSMAGRAPDLDSGPAGARATAALKNRRRRRKRSVAAGDSQEGGGTNADDVGSDEDIKLDERRQRKDDTRRVQRSNKGSNFRAFDQKVVSCLDPTLLRAVFFAKPPDSEPKSQFPLVHTFATLSEFSRPVRAPAAALQAREAAERKQQAALEAVLKEDTFERIMSTSKTAFKELDSDGSNSIDFEEFLGMLDFLNIFLLRPYARRIFDVCDVDGSGELDRSEFELALWINAKAEVARRPPLLEDAFRVFDEDENDGLDVIEFQECLRFLKLNVPDEVSEKAFASAAAEERATLRKQGRKVPQPSKAEATSLTLSLPYFKKAWARSIDMKTEMESRGLRPLPMSNAVLRRKNAKANETALIASTEDDHAKMTQMLGDTRDEGVAIRRAIRLSREQELARAKAAREKEQHRAVKEKVKAAKAERQVIAEQRRQAEVERTLAQRLEREVVERKKLAEQAKRLKLQRMREAQMKERAEAGWGNMDLSNSGLTTIPHELYSGKQAWTRWGFLVSLDLSHNALVRLPTSGMFYPLSALERLDMSHNSLGDLPEEIGELAALRVLLVQHNNLQTFPNGIGRLTKLEKLDARNNNLRFLPDTFGSMGPSLRLLNFANNSLDVLPSAICSLSSLRALDLSLNSLQMLPHEFGELASLTRLDLTWNQLEDFPETMGDLKSLLFLDASHNTVQVLPASFGNMQSLRTLRLIHNNLGTVPKSFGGMRELVDLDISHNDLRLLPKEFGALPSLQLLNLTHNRLLRVPETIGLLINMHTCNLAFNSLASLPLEIGALVSVEKLDVSHSSIKELPDEIGYMSNLTHLNVSFNELEFFPPRFAQLTTLEELRAESNSIHTIPAGIRKLTALRILNLSCNKIKALPAAIGSLGQLTRLDLSANRLESLPLAVANLTSLKQLSLYNNKLHAVPPALGTLFEGLESLDLSRNPLSSLPPKWARRWDLKDQHRTRQTAGWTDEELTDWVSVQNILYDRMCHVWRTRQAEEQTLRFAVFLQDVRASAGQDWHDTMEPHVKQFFFSAQENGVVPRYDTVNPAETDVRAAVKAKRDEEREARLQVVRGQHEMIRATEEALYQVDPGEIAMRAAEREQAARLREQAEREIQNRQLLAHVYGRKLVLDAAAEERAADQRREEKEGLDAELRRAEKEAQERERRKADPVLVLADRTSRLRSLLAGGKLESASKEVDGILLHIRNHVGSNALPDDSLRDAVKSLMHVLGQVVEYPPARGSFAAKRKVFDERAAEPTGLVEQALAKAGLRQAPAAHLQKKSSASARLLSDPQSSQRRIRGSASARDVSLQVSGGNAVALAGPPSRVSRPPLQRRPRPEELERPSTPTAEFASALLGRSAQALVHLHAWRAGLDVLRYMHRANPHDTGLAEELIRLLDRAQLHDEKLQVMLASGVQTRNVEKKGALLRAAATIVGHQADAQRREIQVQETYLLDV